jgi:3-oxoadipate enol-lactonase
VKSPPYITGPLYAQRAGQRGLPIILIHSMPNDHSIWLYQLAHFASWYRVIAVDLPGLGRSGPALEGLTMSDLADACWEAVDAVSDGPAIVIGLSIGAGVAKYMATRAPQRVLALALTGAGYYERDGAMVAKGILARHAPGYACEGIAYRRTQLAGNFSEAFRDSPLGRYFIELFAERNDTADVDSILALLRAHEGPDPADLHRRIAAPTLVVTGELDRSLAQQDALAAHIAGAERAIVPGAGHLCNMEQPVIYDRAVLDFLVRKGFGPGS